MSAPQGESAAQAREPLWLVAAVTLALLAGRLIAAGYGFFFENDSISLAVGTANLLRDSGGDIYRYGPQVGYYQVMVALTRLFGGDVLTIPLLQVTLAAMAGTAIPITALFAFRGDLTRTERWLAALTLAASPILWMTSRYGSSAMISVPLAFAGLAILSNRPARVGEIVALLLVAASIIVRADAVLVTPGVAVLLWRNHGGLKPAVIRYAGLGVFVAAVFAVLFVVDPRMRSLAADVTDHLASPAETMFWEYLVWSTSPFALLFAVLGLRDMVPDRRWLLGIFAAWSLPVMAFYYPAVTQPRYFLLTTFPVAIATAVGITAVARLAGRWHRMAFALAVAVCNVHLLVGLGRFGNGPGHERGWLRESSVMTHTGPLWTGALIYKSFPLHGLGGIPLAHPRFGTVGIERGLTNMFAYLNSGAERGRHILLLSRPGYGHTLHFFSQAAGVRIVSKQPGLLWYKQMELEIGGARVTSIGLRQVEMDAPSVLPVAVGDQVWFFEGTAAPSLPSIAQRLAAGQVLVPDTQLTGIPDIKRYRVTRTP